MIYLPVYNFKSKFRGWSGLTLAALMLTACAIQVLPADPITPIYQDAPPAAGDLARVTRIIDGDTIEVEMNGVGYRVRYIGMNTPERGEPCFSEATEANRALVAGQTVRLERDTSNTDRFGRLLRYVYVGNTFVNAELVRAGWAEAREYPPDTRYAGYFRDLHRQAAAANVGCHPTGIFR